MRRAVVEMPLRDLEKLGGTGLPEQVSSCEIIHFFACDSSGCAGISRMTLKEGGGDFEDLVRSGRFSRAERLSQAEGSYVVYYECEPVNCVARGERWPRVYVGLPTEFGDGRAKMTFFGSAGEIKKLFKLLEKLGVRTRVLSLTDETLDPNSPMTSLTEKQRRILMAAYKSGYYDVPRRADSERLAEALDLDKSTVVEHLRKAEKRLMKQMVGF
ncbi:MAG: helix-turn-helix domain-containing protein [Nitrososphaerota archaeon]|nr:helix-turn-helix domain-containing protein [Nitrososphaerota archaeon]